MSNNVHIIGAGLAGCEAAWQLAERGVKVILTDMKPNRFTKAHKSAGFAELVCSNSLKAERIESAAGLLKEEMYRLGSLLVRIARETRVPAGGALAVDRDMFSQAVTGRTSAHPNITVVCDEVTEIPADGYVIIATGPLTDGGLYESIGRLLGTDYLSFYDAAAPIVTKESIDMTSAFLASRYGRGDDAYINCPMNKGEYEAFYETLVSAESVILHDFDVYEGCMPVEVMAKRGKDTLRFGPLKPVGLTDPKTGHRPWAAVQLRQENARGDLFNMVGFQTNLKFGEQTRVFSKIPALKNIDIVRFGVMHRNSFIDSPRLLDGTYRLKKDNRIYFAGQITGVEGYMESAMSGLVAGINLANLINGQAPLALSRETMCGALTAYVSDPTVTKFQPMGANMGILPPLAEHIRDKRERAGALAERALGYI